MECFEWYLPEEPPAKLREAEPVDGLSVRSVNYRSISSEAKIVRDINNKAMSEIWGYIPMTIDDIGGFLHSLSSTVPPELFLIFEINNEPAGMFLSIPIKRPDTDGNGGVILG